MTKIDPYKHKERYFAWKEKNKERIPELSQENSEIVLRYLSDMELGLNVSVGNRKGGRSYIRLNNLRQRLCFLIKQFEEQFGIKDIKQVSEEILFKFFYDMRNGVFKRKDGTSYQSVGDFVKIIKAFWHWHQKINRRAGKEIRDITIDLDTSCSKPKWVYLTEEQVISIFNASKYDYRVLFTFLYDSGIRAPTELMNIKVSDFFNDFSFVNVREEVSKTFQRKIKLMICSKLIKEYVQSKGLKPGDLLFKISPSYVNRYLQRITSRLFGEDVSEGGEKFSKMTMYDFRHNSACYWLKRYKKESDLKIRFGWKKSDKIYYYTEFKGVEDSISEEDMLIDVTKTELEKRLIKTENENTILKDKITLLEEQMERIQRLTNDIYSRTNLKY